MSNRKIIIFDFNRTIYDPEKNNLTQDVLLILQKLFVNSENSLYLISRDENKEKRQEILRKFDLEKYFQKMFFVSKKSPNLFRKIIKKEKINPDNVYIVGDYLYDEIRYGNMCGVNTIWFKSGKFKDLKPKSRYDYPTKITMKIKNIINQF